ncbi:hypothetical protein F5Y12DRAFT_776361 [Xylaria sp. FL1777]|nr:hypothetical protein F5Y12DRAFT_776361 [Xylaria sp. FL1777]
MCGSGMGPFPATGSVTVLLFLVWYTQSLYRQITEVALHLEFKVQVGRGISFQCTKPNPSLYVYYTSKRVTVSNILLKYFYIYTY